MAVGDTVDLLLADSHVGIASRTVDVHDQEEFTDCFLTINTDKIAHIRQ